MKQNVLINKSYCFGCGVCAVVCPPKIISISLDKEGFYFPQISDPNLCLECGLCSKVCAFDSVIENIDTDVRSYASWSNDSDIRLQSSSGGVSYELLIAALNNGYKAVPVRYDLLKNRAEHYIASNVGELKESLGSKYIQSYTYDALSSLDYKQKYIVVGTPCQVHSLRNYLNLRKLSDNFILIDFFCHGVPSMQMWEKYIKRINKKSRPIDSVAWREKSTGWHDSWGIKTKTGNVVDISKWSSGDLFYKLFLGHFCLGKACHKDCKYKMLNSAADIRLGDLWGKAYSHDEEGVSGVICFNSRGYDILTHANLTLIPHDISVVTEGQMRANAKPAFTRRLTMALLRKNYTGINTTYLPILIEFLINLPKRLINKCIR